MHRQAIRLPRLLPSWTRLLLTRHSSPVRRLPCPGRMSASRPAPSDSECGPSSTQPPCPCSLPRTLIPQQLDDRWPCALPPPPAHLSSRPPPSLSSPHGPRWPPIRLHDTPVSLSPLYTWPGAQQVPRDDEEEEARLRVLVWGARALQRPAAPLSPGVCSLSAWHGFLISTPPSAADNTDRTYHRHRSPPCVSSTF